MADGSVSVFHFAEVIVAEVMLYEQAEALQYMHAWLRENPKYSELATQVPPGTRLHLQQVILFCLQCTWLCLFLLEPSVVFGSRAHCTCCRTYKDIVHVARF